MALGRGRPAEWAPQWRSDACLSMVPLAGNCDMTKKNERKNLRGRAGRMQGGRGSGRASQGAVRLWGRHAVEAALRNPARSHRKLWATREGIASLDGELPADFPVEYADVADLARLVARDAPHQGLVLECLPLDDLHLDEVLDGDA